jgi:hypothetical protein
MASQLMPVHGALGAEPRCRRGSSGLGEGDGEAAFVGVAVGVGVAVSAAGGVADGIAVELAPAGGVAAAAVQPAKAAIAAIAARERAIARDGERLRLTLADPIGTLLVPLADGNDDVGSSGL